MPVREVNSVVEDVACTVCGCVCDDLQIAVEGGRIVRAVGACPLAEPWLLDLANRRPPTAEIEGRPASLDEALAAAAQLLRDSRSPLIYGLSRSSTPGQRAAVRLADKLGATIDTTASLCHAPSIMAVQSVGESTCTLGEIRNRADLVVYWGSNPVKSHPRHLERYGVDPAGMFVPGGRRDRTLVVVDVARTETAARADIFVQVEPDGDFEAIWTLRGLLRGVPPAPGAATGAPLAVLADLAERFKACRCGVFFFGLGLARPPVGHARVESLLRLASELNAFTRFHVKRMRVYGDVAGADSVLCWQTGYPFSVNLARGYPRYNPGEYSAQEMLERGEVDLCLLVGSEGTAALSPGAMASLRRLPTIALDYPTTPSIPAPTVRFTTAIYGVHLKGTAYRMDEVPIPLKRLLPTDYPSDAQVLERLARLAG